VKNPVSENPTVIPMEIIWNRRPKWERRLPSKLVIASAEDSSTSLKLKVELETTDTWEVKSINSFMDSRATGEFIDHHYAKSNWLHTRKLSVMTSIGSDFTVVTKDSRLLKTFGFRDSKEWCTSHSPWLSGRTPPVRWTSTRLWSFVPDSAGCPVIVW